MALLHLPSSQYEISNELQTLKNKILSEISRVIKLIHIIHDDLINNKINIDNKIKNNISNDIAFKYIIAHICEELCKNNIIIKTPTIDTLDISNIDKYHSEVYIKHSILEAIGLGHDYIEYLYGCLYIIDTENKLDDHLWVDIIDKTIVEIDNISKMETYSKIITFQSLKINDDIMNKIHFMYRRTTKNIIEPKVLTLCKSNVDNLWHILL